MSQPMSPETERLVQYMNAVNEVLASSGNNVMTTSTCLDCDTHVDAMGDNWLAHRIMTNGANAKTAVVVGCEGYWHIDPNAVGMSRGSWSGVEGVNI